MLRLRNLPKERKIITASFIMILVKKLGFFSFRLLFLEKAYLRNPYSAKAVFLRERFLVSVLRKIFGFAAVLVM